MRANLWGVTVDGLPAIDGGASGASQKRMLSYLLDRYPLEWQTKGIKAHAERGYTHFWLSIPDSIRPGGLSIAQYCDMVKRVQDGGIPFVCHFLRSKDFDGRNPDPAKVYPVIDALQAMKGIPMACHAWEASLFYSPEHLRTTIDQDARRFPAIKWAVHLQEGYADFGPDGEGHGPQFWKANLKVGVKTLLYQFRSSESHDNPAWSAGMMQARGNDCLVRLVAHGLWGLPETVDWVPFELVGVQLFNNLRDGDGRIADEDSADLKGYETALCTDGPMMPAGFGNGARFPDGAPI